MPRTKKAPEEFGAGVYRNEADGKMPLCQINSGVPF
jgi:hypothetical protein